MEVAWWWAAGAKCLVEITMEQATRGPVAQVPLGDAGRGQRTELGAHPTRTCVSHRCPPDRAGACPLHLSLGTLWLRPPWGGGAVSSKPEVQHRALLSHPCFPTVTYLAWGAATIRYLLPSP